MMFSIRNFLLINLLLAGILTTAINAIGNYYLDQQDIQNHLDILLSQAALSFEALMGKQTPDLRMLQQNFNTIPALAQDYFDKRSKDLPSYKYRDGYQFQIWDSQAHLLLHSANAAHFSFCINKLGFSNQSVAGIHWRVFVAHNSYIGLNYVVAERFSDRNELATRITRDDIYIMLLAFPISGLLIWIIIGRGLSSLKRVAKELSQRAPRYLEPVDLKSVPLEIKPLVDELNKLFLRLQQAFEREKRFAADAAHELRTPLAALKTQAQVALKTSDLTEKHTIVQNVITAADRCAHVVQQLLTLSRLVPEANTIEDLTEVNLTTLTAEIIAHLAPTALDKHIDIELIADTQASIMIGNITALSILIRNLIDNAIRYTPERGEIKVMLLNQPTNIILRIIDNGPGIAAELRSRVFERFFRVLGNKSPGSGLGLAIVQQIAKLHNADVRLGSPPSGVGLEVEVTLPVQTNGFTYLD